MQNKPISVLVSGKIGSYFHFYFWVLLGSKTGGQKKMKTFRFFKFRIPSQDSAYDVHRLNFTAF